MNNLAFTSPYTALLWERFRYFIRYLPVLLFIAYIPSLLALFIWKVSDDEFTASDFFEGLSFLWIVTHFALCSVLIGINNTGKNNSTYPSEHHYLMPVTSLTLTLIQSLFSIVTIVLFWSVFYITNYYLFIESYILPSEYFSRASYLSLGITCYLVLILVKAMCVNLSTKSAEIIPIVLCTMWAFVGIYATDIFSYSIIAISGITTIPLVSHISINKSRTIGIKKLRTNSDSRLIEQSIQNKALPSPFRAQLWYEWKEWGKLGLIMALTLNILGHLIYLPSLWYDTYSYGSLSSLEVYTMNLSIISLLIVSLWVAYSKTKNNTNGYYVYNCPMATRNIYASRYYMSIFISLFCITIPIILAFSHDYFLTNVKLNGVKIASTVFCITIMCTILLSSPIICIGIFVIYITLIESQYELYDNVYFYVSLLFGIILSALHTIFFVIYIYKDMTQFLLFITLLVGLSCSYFFLSFYENPILFTLFMLMTYFIGLHWFVRSRCR